MAESKERSAIVRGGWSLIAATVLFSAVFAYLAATFDYPGVLDRTAADVLPRLLTLGVTGRLVWGIYGLIPLLLWPTARGIEAMSRLTRPSLGRAARWLALLSAAAMMAGLLRWPTLQWTLAQAWASATPASRESMAATFDAANLYLGNIVGEFLGELFLNGFFLVAALAIAAATGRRWLMFAGIAASGLGWVAMLRNLTPLVAPIAALNNIVLPVWMLMLGIVLLVSCRGSNRT